MEGDRKRTLRRERRDDLPLVTSWVEERVGVDGGQVGGGGKVKGVVLLWQ